MRSVFLKSELIRNHSSVVSNDLVFVIADDRQSADSIT